VADALSRRDEKILKEKAAEADLRCPAEVTLMALSNPIPNWLEVIKAEVEHNIAWLLGEIRLYKGL
jgi:hypothetical protein